jgi:N-acetylated-alpha-linked acidic dipeptidase
MILMDMEKHHPKPEASDVLPQWKSDIFRPQPPTKRCLRIYTGVALGVLLLWLKVCTKGTTLNALGRPKAESFPHHRHPLSLEEREKLFLSIPNAESAIEASLAYATHPHLAGSAEDLLDAKTILHLFQDEFGIRSQDPHLPIYDAGSEDSRNATLKLTTAHASSRPNAWIDTYYPVMNTGTEQSLVILKSDGTPAWTADLVEDGDPRDEDAHKYRDTIAPWHGLSCDGDVTGQLVYANYGLKEDYDFLVSKGVNFTGKIILTRYGGNFRGLKVRPSA